MMVAVGVTGSGRVVIHRAAKVDWLDVIFNINSGHVIAVVISAARKCSALWSGGQSLQPWTV